MFLLFITFWLLSVFLGMEEMVVALKNFLIQEDAMEGCSSSDFFNGKGDISKQ